MMVSSTPSFWHTLKSASRDALSSVPWWKQQSWVVVTEILMGFLAAWGLMQSLPAWLIGVGLGVVYAVNALVMWSFRRYGRLAGVLSTLMVMAVFVAANLLGGPWRWLGLCMSIGVLLSFRDHQSVQSMAWVPVRALRRGNSSLTSLTITSLLSAVLLAVCLALSGWVSAHWKWLPHLLVLIAFGVFVPEMIVRMGHGVTHPITPKSWKAAHGHELSWLLKLGVAFNAVNFLGRRLIIPAMIVRLASTHFGSASVMPILGATLGLIGVLSAAARVPMVFSGKMSAMSMLKWGARLSLMGWGLLCLGLLAWGLGWMPASWMLVPIILGWSMLELTNRTWSVAYMEQLRVSTVGDRISAARAHRRALHRFMVRKSTGAAVGCTLGGMMAPVLAPAMVVVLLVGCWVILERHPQSLSPTSMT